MAIKIEMLPTERVSNLENEFQNKIGIPIQILKLENGIWRQTSGLDNLTLKYLNILIQFLTLSLFSFRLFGVFHVKLSHS